MPRALASFPSPFPSSLSLLPFPSSPFPPPVFRLPYCPQHQMTQLLF